MVTTADNGDDSSHYLSVGINSSQYSDSINYPLEGANDAYVQTANDNLFLIAGSSNKKVYIQAGGTQANNLSAMFTPTGVVIPGALSVGGNSAITSPVQSIGNSSSGNVALWMSPTSIADSYTPVNSIVTQKTVSNITSNYNVQLTDGLLLCDCSTNNIIINLPAIGTVIVGKEYYISKIDNTSNNITVQCIDGQLISGKRNWQIQYQWSNMSIISNGTGWNIT